jgi:hypothetical protein
MWLDRNGFAWEYEPAAFKAERGEEYLPDFSFGPLPQGLGWNGTLATSPAVPAFLEVKPAGVSIRFWQRRMEVIWTQLPSAVLVISAPPEDVLGVTDAGQARDAALVRVGLGPEWESDEPLWGPTWDGGWFGRCRDCEGTSLFFSPGHWACHRCGYYEGPGTWSEVADWPYAPNAWREVREGVDA